MALFTRSGVETAPNCTLNGKPARAYVDRCRRCGGAGGWQGWPGWTCYDCGGTGQGPNRVEKLYDAEKLAKLNAAQAKRDAKKTAERNAAEAERVAKLDGLLKVFFEQHPDVSRWLTAQEEGNEFAGSLKAQLLSRGSLSEAQIEAVRKSIAREAAKAASEFVGAEGERREFTLTVDRVFDFTISRFPLIVSYTNICHDDAGNVIVYRGSKCWENGSTIKVKATVKEHGEYKGTKQTVISRPKEVA